MKNSKKIIEIIKRPKTDGGKIHFGVYQREYCWKKRNFSDFILTLQRAIKTKTAQPFGVVATYCEEDINTASTIMEIVDGQQRITTLSLFMVALYYACNDDSIKNELREILFTTDNRPMLNYDYASSSDENQNNIYYEILVNNSVICSKSAIAKCYQYFIQYLKKTEYSFRELWLGIKRLIVMESECETREEALLYFRTINGYGVKVTTQENVPPLFENAISEYDGETICETLYEQYYKIRPQLFIKPFFIIDWAYAVCKESIYKKNIDDFIEQLLINTSWGVHNILNSMTDFMAYEDNLYENITSILGKKYTDMLHLNVYIDTSEFRHLMFDLIGPWKIIDYTIEKDELFNFITVFEKCFMRQLLSGRRGATSHAQKLDGIINKVVELSVNNNMSLPKAFEGLVKSQSIMEFPFIPDVELRPLLQTKNIYALRVCKLLLNDINTYLSGGENCLDVNALTIEHILPQSTKHPLAHTLGNLTLLVGNQNSSLSNKTYDEKKTLYLNSQIKLNKYFNEKDQWDEDNILERTNILTDILLNNILKV